MRDELTELTTSHSDLMDALKQRHAQSTAKAKTATEETIQGLVQEWTWKLDQKQREMIKAVDNANENLQARHQGALDSMVHSYHRPHILLLPSMNILLLMHYIISSPLKTHRINPPYRPTLSTYSINSQKKWRRRRHE